MAMKWFWRMVCAPDCSDSCQINCPGCRAMADEWREQGHTTPVTVANPPKGRWQDFRHAVSCWSRSSSARLLSKLNPLRVIRGEPAAAAGCCGSGASQPAAQTAGCCGTAPTPPAAQTAGCCGTDSPAPTSTSLPVATDVGIKLGGGADDPVRAAVREYYDQQARQAREQNGDESASALLPAAINATSSYASDDLSAIPIEAIQASLGCGNPFARAELAPGEVVLDLGSGAGMDALVAARRVGVEGHVFGLDMSDDMIALATASAAAAGVTNVAFLKGGLESVPLPRGSVDVIISNCVVNLVPDKAQAMREAFRVLRPNGRLSISDVVTREPVPAHLKGDLLAWAACAGGALSVDEYRAELAAAGFVDIEIEQVREYTAADAEMAGLTPILERSGLLEALKVGFANTNVCARKPVPAAAKTEPTSGPPAVADTRLIEEVLMDTEETTGACGNPFPRAEIKAGETVLNLGAGTGTDALVAVRHVGPQGHVYGLETSEDATTTARRAAADAGVTNATFFHSSLDSVPLPPDSIDVLISNCVINMTPDKEAVLREAHRVMRPDGRLSFSEMVTLKPVPEHLRADLSAWLPCAGGAFSVDEYQAALAAAGFVDIEIERLQEYSAADAEEAGLPAHLVEALQLGFAITSVYARKGQPAAGSAADRKGAGLSTS